MHAWKSVGIIGVGVMAACAPNTVIRRTALINTPQAPTREGQPLERGEVRIEAHAGGINTGDDGAFFIFEPDVAEVGDPGVLIPNLQLGGSIYAGLPGGLEFGAQLYYAAMDWADPNVVGVLPFPEDQEEDLLMGGFGLRLNVDVGNPQLALAFLAEVNIASIPEATFVCTDEERCSGDSLTFTGDELYRFDHVDHETFFLPTLGVQLGWRFGNELPDDGGGGDVRYEESAAPPLDGEPDSEEVALSVMPYLGLGMQASVTNTGFDPDLGNLPDDTLEQLWVGYFSVGVDARIAQLVLGASMLVPIEGEDAIDFGLVFNFRVGVQL